MKQKSIILALLIAGAVPSFAFASANNNLSVEIARTNAANNLIQRINLLHKLTEKYILQTGDVNPTIDKIDALFNLNKNVWLNYDKNSPMKVSVVMGNENAIIIENSISPSETNIANYIQNSRRLDALGVVNIIKQKQPDGTEKIAKINIEFPFSTTLTSFVNAMKNDIPKQYPNGKISYTQPADSTITTWLKPDGNGNFVVYQKNSGGQWDIIGMYYPGEGFSSITKTTNYIMSKVEEKTRPLIRVDNISALKGKILPKSSLATDIKGNMYVTDGEGNWYLIEENTGFKENPPLTISNSPISSYKIGYYSFPGAKGVFTDISFINLENGKNDLVVKNTTTNKYSTYFWSINQKDFSFNNEYSNGEYYLFLNKDISDNSTKVFFYDPWTIKKLLPLINIENEKIKFIDSNINSEVYPSFVILTNKHLYIEKPLGSKKPLEDITNKINQLINKNIINIQNIKEAYIIQVNSNTDTENNINFSLGLILINNDDTGIIINPNFGVKTISTDSNEYIKLNKKISHIYFINPEKNQFIILYKDGTADYFAQKAMLKSGYVNFIRPSLYSSDSFSFLQIQKNLFKTGTNIKSFEQDLKNSLKNIKKVLVGGNGFYLFDKDDKLKVGINIIYDNLNYYYDLKYNSFLKNPVDKIISNNFAILFFMKNNDVYFNSRKIGIKSSDIKHVSPLSTDGFLIETKDNKIIPLSLHKIRTFKLSLDFTEKIKQYGGIKKVLCSSNFCVFLTNQNKMMLWAMEDPSIIKDWRYGILVYKGTDSNNLKISDYQETINNVKDFQILTNRYAYFETLNGQKYWLKVISDVAPIGYIYPFNKNYTPAILPFVKRVF